MRLFDTKLKTVLLCVFTLLLFCLGAISVNRVFLFSLYPDEFGYWAGAAYLDGVDFSDMTYLGSTYSFGYGLILWPIFHLFTEAAVAYRVAVSLNFVFMAFSLYLMYGFVADYCDCLADGHAHVKITRHGSIACAVIAACGVFYASWIFYSSTTLAESISMFLFVLLMRLYQKYSVTRKTGYAVGTVAVSAAMYAVHSRMLVVIIALAISFAFDAIVTVLKKRKREEAQPKEAQPKRILPKETQPRADIGGGLHNCFVLIACLIILIVVSFAVHGVGKYFDSVIFKGLNEDALNRNEAGAVTSRLALLTDKDNLLRGLIGFIGKISYLILASLGFAYYAVKWCVRRLKKEQSAIALMLLLTVAGMLAVSTIYLISDSDIDSLIYGRYDEFVLPILITLGIIEWIEEGQKKRISVLFQTVVICFIGFIGFAMATAAAFRYGLSKVRTFMVTAIVAFKHPAGSDSAGLMVASLLMIFIIVLITVAMYYITGIENTKKKSVILSGFLMLVVVGQIGVGLYISKEYIFDYAESTREDISLCEIIEKVADNGGDIIFVRENNSRFVDALKMQMRYRRIIPISENDLDVITADDVVITVYNTKHSEELYEMFDCCKIGDLLGIFYNSSQVN